MKNGYYWAATPDGELFVLLNIDGRGFVPAVEDDINMAAVTILEPVTWPSQVTAANQASSHSKRGAPAAGAVPECVVLPFAASA